MKRLPEKLSDLIELALRDLRKVEKDERYMVDMGSWHEPNSENGWDQVCLVCFAGAVMAETLEMPIDKDLFPSDVAFDNYTKVRLDALDLARIGAIEAALQELDVDPDEGWEEMAVTPYGENREEFHSEMKDIAVKLRIAGY